MKEEKLTNWQTILIVLILSGLIFCLFGTEELSRWNREIETKRPRILFNLLLTPFYSFADSVEIDAIIPAYKDRFHDIKEKTIKEIFPNVSRFLLSKLPEQFIPGFLHSPETLTQDSAIIESIVPEVTIQGVPPETPPVPVPVPVPEPILHDPIFTDNSESITMEVPAVIPAAEKEQPLIIQDTPPPPPEPTPGLPRGESILLMGDSLANSCGTAFVPLISGREDLELVKYGKVSANLSNPVFDEWFEDLDEILVEKKFDIIIIMMGANAAQAIVDGDDRWAYGSVRWEEIYRQRATNLISRLKNSSSKIYWVGIPPMLKKNYRDKMEGHNQRIAELCRDLAIEYLPIGSVIGDEAGQYLEYKIIDGRQVRIRTADGVHYSRAGGDILSKYILTTLFPDISFSTRN
ncbi:MAG: DUF459 domain-containing protein [Spirochaetales bacterium]|nr:DUF459 domain-containing protein [Spirochaetales bacterium]